MIGMGERTTPQAVLLIARALFQAERGHAGPGGPPAQVAQLHAPRHGDHDVRPRPGHAVPRRRRARPGPGRSGPATRPATSSSRSSTGRCVDAMAAALGVGRRCGSSRPAATRSRPSASSGTTATTSSPSSPASSSPTSATPAPTPQLRKAGIEVITIAGLRARPRPRRLALHDLPARARRLRTASRRTRSPPCPTTCATAASSRRSTSARASCASCCKLSEALKTAKYAGTEVQRLDGQGDRPDLREDLDPHPVRVRGRRLRPGRPRHLPRPVRLADGPQGVGGRHRPGARAHVRRHRVPRQRARPTSRRSPSTPACPSTTA